MGAPQSPAGDFFYTNPGPASAKSPPGPAVPCRGTGRTAGALCPYKCLVSLQVPCVPTGVPCPYRCPVSRSLLTLGSALVLPRPGHGETPLAELPGEQSSALTASGPALELSSVGKLGFAKAALPVTQLGRLLSSPAVSKGTRWRNQPGLGADPGCCNPISLALPPPRPRALCSHGSCNSWPSASRLPPPSGLHLGELMFFTGL